MEATPPQPSIPASQPAGAYMPPAPPPPPPRPVSPWIWIAAGGTAIALAALTIPAVRNVRQQASAVAAVVSNLHANMAKHDDQAIFSQSDPAYQQQVGQQKSHHLFTYIDDNLGAPISPHLTGTNMSADNKAGQILTLEYKTAFAKGTGIETIKFHKVNGHYLLLSYSVESTQLPPSKIPDDLKSD